MATADRLAQGSAPTCVKVFYHSIQKMMGSIPDCEWQGKQSSSGDAS